MERDERSKVQRILGSSSEVTVQFIVYTVSQVRLLEQSSLFGLRLSSGEEGSQNVCVFGISVVTRQTYSAMGAYSCL